VTINKEKNQRRG